ncbi:stage III sporulation protein AH [Halobacillus locisalis]|uniref:Stage III sporulation protein AH n=1 Tax=Halobacillus locisalis TaxID=220753 RepID=A0A838CWE2_9BACI|nr:stage III sporulation protein AH [Halobacillus locisalis]MBA2176231.1 stage III sporulation protein AH [Halobacillus locisalis]
MNTIHDIDLKGDDYRSLIELASKKCDRFAFVKRRDMMADEKVALKYHNEWVKDIQSSFIERKAQSEWPGTQLFGATAYVFYYELNEQTKLFLQSKAHALFDWVSPLPEDLMFYNGDDIWLAGCSHERFIVTEEYKDFNDLMNSI